MKMPRLTEVFAVREAQEAEVREIRFLQLPQEVRSSFVEAHREAAERRLRAAEKKPEYRFIADEERRWLGVIARGEMEDVLAAGKWRWYTDGETIVGMQFDDRFVHFRGGRPEERELESADLVIWDGGQWYSGVPWVVGKEIDQPRRAMVQAMFMGKKFGKNPHAAMLGIARSEKVPAGGGLRN